MPTHVTDAASHRQDKILNAAKVVGRSAIRQKVFNAICSGKKLVKTVEDIQAVYPELDYMQIRKAAIGLIHEELVGRAKVDGKLAYRRDLFYSKNKDEIIRLAKNRKRQEKYPTSYQPRPNPKPTGVLRIAIPAALARPAQITVDDIENFRRVRGSRNAHASAPAAESMLKKGLKKILGEQGTFKDWGGETDDLFTTRLRMKGKRMTASFGLKGKGTTGKLTPKKMGKNGDQIQRLFRDSADVYIVLYCGEVDQSIYEQLRTAATAKSYTEARPIYFGVIDGQDTQRLIKAYPSQFDVRN